MRTNRECTNRDQNRERGVVGLVLLGIIVVVMAVAAFFFVARKQDNKTAQTDTQTTTTTEGSTQESTRLQRNQVNTQRRADAAMLLSATSEYVYNNSGNMPREIHDSMLTQLDYYDTATLAMGEQDPVITDELRLVLGATCAADGSTVAGSSRSFAVQFGLRDVSNGETFNPECQEN
jgi:flagellar basal body-associated protein FliL